MKKTLVRTALVLASALVVSHRAPAAPRAKPAAEAMPVPRTGERKIVDVPGAVGASVTEASVDATEELLRVKIEWPEGRASAGEIDARSVGGGHAFAFVAGEHVWVRRSSKDAGRGIEGTFYTTGDHGLEPARHFHYAAATPPRSALVPSVREAYGEELGAYFRDYSRRSPFNSFAAERVRERYAKAPPKTARPNTAPERSQRDELERLMETTTGMTSIQEGLQADRPLWLQVAKDKTTVALSSLKGPPLAKHPFETMLRALKRSVPDEKLAAAAPADFYYARLNDLDVFFKLIDQLDAWATPALNVIESHGEDHALAQRTLTQLGLERGPLARALGTQVVAELALVGSDPYVREGSDITVLFRVKQKGMFDAALSGALTTHLATHGAQPATSVTHEGVEIRVQRSTDGAVRQHRATVGDVEIVSTSLRATRHVIDTIAGRAPKLADEPDLRYMLARGAGERTDGFVFLGDRFIAEVVGPRQKILEARRQLALTELLVPGYAALLYGLFEGRVPASIDELFASGLLKKDELRHAIDGAAITFSPGHGGLSPWGTPSALEPLYDLPSPQMISAAEKGAYERFAQGYQQYWRQYMDPVAIRIGVETKAGDTKLTADVRVLPLITGSDYRDIDEMVGHARLTTPALADGFRAVLGIGADARLRREVTQLAGSSPFGQRFVFDWLGDWLFFGVEDKPATARSLDAMERHAIPQAPVEVDPRDRDNELATMLKTPAYLAIGVRNAVGPAIFLAAAKKLATDAAPGMITWGEGAPYKSARIVRISIAPKSMGSGSPGGSLYYVLTEGALIFALSEDVLRHLIDERARKDRTDATEKEAGSAQLVVEWGSNKGAPLNQILGWLLEAAGLRAEDRSRARAESLLRGAPGADLRAIGLAYEGSVPVPIDGGSYTLAPDGVRDPARGSSVAERWPALPVPGSPVAKLVNAVMHFRGEVSFDEEPHVEGLPPMRSLHAKVVLGLH